MRSIYGTRVPLRPSTPSSWGKLHASELRRAVPCHMSYVIVNLPDRFSYTYTSNIPIYLYLLCLIYPASSVRFADIAYRISLEHSTLDICHIAYRSLVNKPVEFTEINAALGQAALCVHIIASRCGVEFKGYHLSPMGSCPRISKADDRRTSYPLFIDQVPNILAHSVCHLLYNRRLL
jgi:hypothetical protein